MASFNKLLKPNLPNVVQQPQQQAPVPQTIQVGTTLASHGLVQPTASTATVSVLLQSLNQTQPVKLVET